MNYHEFIDSLKLNNYPQRLDPHLQALWYDATGDWNTAHEIIQQIDDSMAARIHAYLHRKEGDSGNADYWYARSGAERPRGRLAAEWEALARELLAKGDN